MELEHWGSLIEEGRSAAIALPADSATRAVATDEWFVRLKDSDPPYGTAAPPLLLHLIRLDHDELLAFDADLGLIEAAMPPGGSRQEFLRFGQRHDPEAARQWVAGLVELGVQAHLLRELGDVRAFLSPQLPNGGRADIAIDLPTTQVWIEVSILSDADAVIDTFDTAKSVQSSWGDPYADARRVYGKVFEKTWGSKKRRRGQLHPDQPSIVIVGDVAWMSPGYSSPGFGWALDQLTDPAKRDDRSRAALSSWLDDIYGDDASAALASLSALSAVAVIRTDLSLVAFRPNESADDHHRLGSDELDRLERLLNFRPRIT